MDIQREQQVHRLFLQVLDKDAESRRAYLDKVCSRDLELKRLVLERIDDFGAVEENLKEVGMPLSSGADAEDAHRASRVGQRIGPYRITRKLGEGGMGAVYLADRDDGEFHMQVALKVTRGNRRSEDSQRRFRKERQIMANLKHPFITTLHDGGSTPDGHPYFVMEYVDGLTIDRYCQENNPHLDERLELFRKVCEGVAFAHENLVVHRDIKPSNILVNQWGEPKLLDFGIAKEQIDDSQTATSARLLTPAYASPEQVKGEESSFASDIYSLGVLLYELLTGRLPYSFEGKPNHEIGRMICEEIPVRPSRLISGEHEGDQTALSLSLKSSGLADLDDIVLRALHKDPGSRFSSAAQFVENIRYFQKGLRIFNTGEKTYDVTLCHGLEDGDEARTIHQFLHSRLQVTPKIINTGEDLQKEDLEHIFDEVNCCIILVGSVSKPWQNSVVRAALSVRATLGLLRVFFIVLPGASRLRRETSLPAFLRDLPWISLNQLEEKSFLERVVPMIEARGPGPIKEILRQGVCPFRGLEAFQEEDRKFFFGRELLTERLTQYLQKNRFLAVLGPSGSGKSSVVRAGLISKLRKDDYPFAIFTPTVLPLKELAYALANLDGSNPDQLFIKLKQERGFLHRFAVERRFERLFVVIDQFEEVFTQTNDPIEQERFINHLLHAVDQPGGPVSVVLTMRSDFLGQCTSWPDLNSYVSDNLIQIAPMNRQELQQAVEMPARLVGLTFEEGLIQHILDDVSGAAGELPLLQHALLELYENREDGMLTAAAYTKIGGIEGALARRADCEFKVLSAEEQAILRRIFVLCLIQTVVGSENTTRRIATRDEVLAVDKDSKLVEALVQRWTAARLLTIRGDQAREVDLIEVAHEALIQRWGPHQNMDV